MCGCPEEHQPHGAMPDHAPEYSAWWGELIHLKFSAAVSIIPRFLENAALCALNLLLMNSGFIAVAAFVHRGIAREMIKQG